MKKGDRVIDTTTGRKAVIELTNNFLALIIYTDERGVPLESANAFCFVSLKLLEPTV